ncbi:MAG: RbsD/FucU domain-containing protein [Terriglobales bacterium]|jgi:D-ribose pyranose/furanose isomerase RbsD
MTVAPGITKPDWKRELKALLPLFGHRNWIVVADSAYPAQSRPGIDTIVSGVGQIEAARRVLDAIAASKHVRARIYLDQELEFVAEADAPGVSRYRTQLAELLKSAKATTLPHEQIIARLDQAAQLFRVLIIKTELTIPYTSIFFELDCGYWCAEAEQRLRRAMAASAKKQ